MHLSLVGFDCFLGIVELATGLVMGALGGLELELGFLDRGLGLGGGCLECGGLGHVGVSGGHGRRRRSEKEKLNKEERKKRKGHNSRLLLFVRRKNHKRE